MSNNAEEFVFEANDRQYRVQTPAGTSLDQARSIFDQQNNSGALKNIGIGQTIQGMSKTVRSSANQVRKLSSVPVGPTASAVGVLKTIPATTSIGSLNPAQVTGLIAQAAKLANQSETTVSAVTGIGKFGITPKQLEQQGFLKPGTVQQYLTSPDKLLGVLASPTVWSGKSGISNLSGFLSDPKIQNLTQQNILSTGFSSLKALGVVSGKEPAQQLSALVGGAGQFGVENMAAWAKGLAPAGLVNQINTVAKSAQAVTNIVNKIPGLSGVTGGLTNLPGVSNLAGGLSGLTGGLTSGLTGSLGGLTSGLTGSLGGSLGSLTGSLGGSLGGLTGALGGLGSLGGLAGALGGLGGLAGGLGGLFGGGGKAANIVRGDAIGTVNRLGVDAALKRFLGSSKVPAPTFKQIVRRDDDVVFDTTFQGFTEKVLRFTAYVADVKDQFNNLYLDLQSLDGTLGSSLSSSQIQIRYDRYNTLRQAFESRKSAELPAIQSLLNSAPADKIAEYNGLYQALVTQLRLLISAAEAFVALRKRLLSQANINGTT